MGRGTDLPIVIRPMSNWLFSDLNLEHYQEGSRAYTSPRPGLIPYQVGSLFLVS